MADGLPEGKSMRMRTRGAVVATAVGVFGLVAGTGIAEASTTSHTYGRGSVSFKSTGDTITVRDTRSDGYRISVYVNDRTNGKNYALECGSGTHRAPVTVKCVRNYPEGHRIRFVTYAERKDNEIRLGEFTARA